MKSFITTLSLTLFILVNSLVYAQSPVGFNFQTVIRDAAGNPMPNTPVTIQLGVHTMTSAIASYYEIHTATTDAFGYVNLVLGDGQRPTGNLAGLNWENTPYRLNVRINAGSGYVNLGYRDLKSVPYSFHASTSNVATDMELKDLTNVTTVPPTTGQVLRYNGSVWANSTIQEGLWIPSGNHIYYPTGTSGFVGVGTSTPIEKFHIKGSGVAKNNLFLDGGGQSLFIANGTITGLQLKYNGSNRASIRYSIAPDGLSFFTDYSSPLALATMFLGSNGRLGIGSTAPTAMLDVYGPSGTTPLKLTSNGTLRMFVNSSGNMGLGVNTALAKFHMNDNGIGSALRIDINGSNILRTYANGGTMIGRSSFISSAPDDGLLVVGNLHVGSEDGATGYKMAVDGKIICEEVRVQLEGNWPDYVFADDYNLTPLSEVARHIEAHKHLPGIPSAKEVESEGFTLGEMQRRMMEKIEELTLHTIRQQEEIERLKEKLEEKE